MTRVALTSAALVAVTALAVGACGGSSSDKPASASSGAAKPASGAVVRTARTSLGNVIVDGRGRTLYLFAKDAGPKSTCSGGCATDWPPFTATAVPKAGSGVTSSGLSLTMRSDGHRQVVLDGHPLYYYAGDQGAGDLNGQGIDAWGAKWFVVDASGRQVTATAPAGSSTARGGYGY